jgi:large subunit ribosomal protein L15
MKLSELRPPKGAVTNNKRRGRGNASGTGGTAGRGHKGARARAGGKKPAYFEGGQMPIIRRIPKRGFFNPFHKEYAVVNLKDLARFESGQVVDPAILRELRIVKAVHDGIKILSEGELSVPLTVKAHKFSAKAKEKILAAGGTVEELKG